MIRAEAVLTDDTVATRAIPGRRQAHRPRSGRVERGAWPRLTAGRLLATLALCSLAGVLAGIPAIAETWIVESGCDPGSDDCDCDRIQPCMDAAAPGDTVLVRSGVYTEQETRTIEIGQQLYAITACVFLANGVRLLGEDLGVAGATPGRRTAAVVDAGGLGIGLFAAGAGAATTVDQLQIRNGDATGSSFNGVGGGMLCVAGAPVVTRCVFETNQAKQGGGLACELGASPTVTRNIFSGNLAVLDGGAVLCALGAATITDNLFVANEATQGAAISYVAAGRIADNIFRSNLGSDFQAHIAIQDGRDTGPMVIIESNVFHDNTSAIFVTTNPLTILRSNTMVRGAAGIDGREILDTVEIANNLIASQDGAGIAWRGAGPVPSVTCNDVWQNGANYVGLDDPTGTGDNISADPLHCNPLLDDFTLAGNSPCAATASGCGLRIGALPVGCPPSAVEARSWGAIKATYR